MSSASNAAVDGFGADPKGANRPAPVRVAVLGKVLDIPGERRLAWTGRVAAEYVNITLKEYQLPLASNQFRC